MATAQRKDPFRTFNFIVEADGRPLGSFSEVAGLNADGDSVDYRAGDKNENLVDKLPGLRKVANITLKRGFTQNRDLWAWYADIANGITRRRNVTITLRDEKRKSVLSWSCRNCWRLSGGNCGRLGDGGGSRRPCLCNLVVDQRSGT